MLSYGPDESPETVKTFNLEMREFIESGGCAPQMKYIDVYNMTEQLAVNYTAEATLMTPDQVHWGMAVNMNKAQIILNDILKE
jgi:hypothetical protein